MKHKQTTDTNDSIRQPHPTDPNMELHAELSRRTFLFSLGALALAGCGADLAAGPSGAGQAGGTKTASLLSGTGFVHPGLLHTQADFDRMAAKYTTSPWSGSWNLLINNSHASLSYTPNPQTAIYRGYAEVRDGFTKNIAYAFEGLTGVLLVLFTVFSMLAWIVPPVVLAAALLGAPVAGRDVGLAAVAFGAIVAARLGMSIALRYPLWTAVTQPLMAAAWIEIIVRSFVRRFLRREVEWRGRRYDAKDAGF